MVVCHETNDPDFHAVYYKSECDRYSVEKDEWKTIKGMWWTGHKKIATVSHDNIFYTMGGEKKHTVSPSIPILFLHDPC